MTSVSRGAMGTGAPVCLPCGLELEKPAHLDELLGLLAREDEPLVLLTHLLRWCRDEHPTLWERTEGSLPGLESVLAASGELSATPGCETTVNQDLRLAMAEALRNASDVAPVAVARALAVLIDEWFWPTFAESFRCRSPYQPGVGDPVPLDSPDMRGLTAMTPTAPPWRLANRLDETRHVRLAGEWAVRFRVVFDYSAYEHLSGVLSSATVVATCHPNESLSELDVDSTGSESLFPVSPLDPRKQQQIVDELIRVACEAGASIVVLPELATTEGIVTELESWVRREDGPDLLVAGSFHHETTDAVDGMTRRANTAVAWLRGHSEPLMHDKHSSGDRPADEGIQPQGWPELRVYVGADGCHLVLAICRDLLNPSAVHTLTEVGANLVLVPAMSETLTPFVGSVAALVAATQALVAVSNNPAIWPARDQGDVSRPARALVGHPGMGQLSRVVAPDDPSPGMALLHVTSGQLLWREMTSRATTHHSGMAHPSAAPEWARRLAEEVCVSGLATAREVRDENRRAAVLVLLSAGAGEPCVVLTTRSEDLSLYPGRIVFPGGLVDEADDGVIDAALREAREEVGIEPSTVQILGVMTPMALPDAGLTVYPVLGWNAMATGTGWRLNHAEVEALAEVPLRVLARAAPEFGDHLSTGERDPIASGLGEMTRAVTDRLLGAAWRTPIRVTLEVSVASHSGSRPTTSGPAH